MNLDDPKLTAYALHELDPAERAELEALLRDDPDALTAVEETRTFAATLRAELAAEPAQPLHESQRVLLLEKAAVADSDRASENPHAGNGLRPVKVGVLPMPSGRGKRSWIPAAIAASIIVTAGIAGVWGLFRYEGLDAVIASSGISDPRPISPRLGDGIIVSIGDAITGKKVGQQLYASNDRFIVDGDMPPVSAPSEQLASAPKSAQSAPIVNAITSTTTAGRGETVAEQLAKMPALARSKDWSGQVVPEKPAKGTSETVDLNTASEGTHWDSQGGAIRTYTKGLPATMAGRAGGIARAKENQNAVPSPSYTKKAEEPGSPADKSKLLADTQTFLAAGRYDMAAKNAGQILSADPTNIVARKAMETINTARERYAASAYNEARSRAIWKLDPAPSGDRLAAGNAPADVQLQQNYVTLNEPRDLSFETASKADTASYEALTDNAFLRVGDAPLSTFSIDVDTASYANVRRFLNDHTLPPPAAVRVEELVNYFHYDYPQPDGAAPFSSTMEVAACPWAPEHRLVRIGLHGREIQRDDRAASNLVFLVDVSGSMHPAERLPLLKRSMALLVDQLTERDSVAIVVYAGSGGCALDSTHDKRAVRDALDRLESGGSTNGASGIQLAYEIAQKHFIKGGTNRVILATDGDFNVGITDQSELVRLIERKAKGGVFLTCLGFGTDNLKDSTLEKLADKGNGNYAYIDSLTEGRRVLVEQMAGTLITIAKDVKIQVEFNPSKVGAYRLIGYENRLLKKEDFNDDTKDAGEIGSGTTVTALYEIVPPGKEIAPTTGVDPLKYQSAAKQAPEPLPEPPANPSPELLTLKLRYKAPDGDTSKLLSFPLTDTGAPLAKSSRDFRFAAAVASFGMLLRESPHRGDATFDSTLELAKEGKGDDRDGYRAEFIGLVEKAKALAH